MKKSSSWIETISFGWVLYSAHNRAHLRRRRHLTVVMLGGSLRTQQRARFLDLGLPVHVASSPTMFEIVGPLINVETIAVGAEIRELPRLRRAYGKGRWRKRKGVGRVRLRDGSVHTAEIHWYEAHGIGRKEHKIKKFLR